MNIKRIIVMAAVATSATLPSSGALVVREATAGMGYAATSVNAAVFRGGSVTSISNIQYVAYYDADGCLTLGRRLLGESEFACQKTQYYGSKTDGHNVISIIVDGDGYLHCSFNQHSSAFHYARSTAPDSLTLGSEEPMIGTLESYVTYPEFHRLADGSLIFFYRDGSSGNGNLVLNRYSLSTRKWTRVHDNIVGGTGTYVGKMYTSTSRNAYPQMCVDKNGVIHLSWVWRESSDVATNHDMCYAKSEDGGVTWKKSDGTAYATIPITIDTAEQVWEIPQQSELINQTSMTTMPDGRPVIATYWRSSDSSVPQYRLLYLAADGTWKMRQISNRTTAFSLSGSGTKAIPIARPQVVSDDRRMMVMARDVERGWKASLYVSTPTDDGEWKIIDLTDYAVNEWEPSYDRELWRDRGWLDIYVQDVSQGDGEGTTTKSATEVRVLEVSAAPEVISMGERNSMTNAWLKANVENIALQYKIDLTSETDRARICVCVQAAGADAVTATPDENGVATLVWPKTRRDLIEDVELWFSVDGISFSQGTEPRIVSPHYAAFSGVEPRGGTWSAEGAGYATADGTNAWVWGESLESPADFALTERTKEKRIVVVEASFKFDGVDSLPSEMPDPTTTALAMCDDTLYAWTDGGWAALGGVDVKEDDTRRVRIELDYLRRTVRYCVEDGCDMTPLSPVSGGTLAMAGSETAMSGIACTGAARFGTLDGTILVRNGLETSGFAVRVR